MRKYMINFIIRGEELKDLNEGLHNGLIASGFVDISKDFYVGISYLSDDSIYYYFSNDKDEVWERCRKRESPDTCDLKDEVDVEYLKKYWSVLNVA